MLSISTTDVRPSAIRYERDNALLLLIMAWRSINCTGTTQQADRDRVPEISDAKAWTHKAMQAEPQDDSSYEDGYHSLASRTFAVEKQSQTW